MGSVATVAAAQKAVARKTGWPIGMVMNKPEFALKPTALGTLGDLIREATRERFMLFEYWEPTDQVFSEVFNEFSKSYI